MKKSAVFVLIKSLTRQPLLAALLSVLLCLSVVLFASQFFYAYRFHQETERIGEGYPAIAYLSAIKGEGNFLDVTEGVKLLGGSEQLRHHDLRANVRANLKEGYAPLQSNLFYYSFHPELETYQDFGLLPATSYAIVRVTALKADPAILDQGLARGQGSDAPTGYWLYGEVQRHVAGHPALAPEGAVRIAILPRVMDHFSPEDEIDVGSSYLMHLGYDQSFTDFYVPTEAWKDHLLLQRFQSMDQLLYPVDKGDAFRLAQEAPLSSEAFAIQQCEDNAKRVILTGSTALDQSVPFQSNMDLGKLTAGRLLSHEDHLEARPVCVVPQAYAEAQGLAIGDKFLVDILPEPMYSFGTYYDLPRPLAKEHAQSLDLVPKEQRLEIVGFFESPAVFLPEFYVPRSLLGLRQETLERYVPQKDFSFVLAHSNGKATFLESYEDLLREQNLKAVFVPSHGDAYWEAVLPMRSSAWQNTKLFALLSMGIFALTASSFLWSLRHSYRVYALLGLPKRFRWRAYLLALLPLALPAMALGLLFGLQHSEKKLLESFASLDHFHVTEASTGLPLPFICLCFFVLLLSFLTLVLLSLAWIDRKPLLAYMQDADGPTRAVQNALPETSAPVAPLMEQAVTALIPRPAKAANPQNHLRVLREFTRKLQARRTAHSLLAVLLAMGAVFALSSLQQKIESNRIKLASLVEELPVVGIITGRDEIDGTDLTCIRYETFQELMESGLLSKVFTFPFMTSNRLARQEAGEKAERLQTMYCFLGIRDVEEFFLSSQERDRSHAYFYEHLQSADEGDFTVHYADGYGPDDLYGLGAIPASPIPLLMHEDSMKELGLKLLDRMAIMGQKDSLPAFIMGSFTGRQTIWHATEDINEKAILLPANAMEAAMAPSIHYGTLRFDMAPEHKDKLGSVLAKIETMLSKPDPRFSLKLSHNAQEFFDIVRPLERSLNLMKILKPLLLVSITGLATLLAYLRTSQHQRDAAVFLSLGLSRRLLKRFIYPFTLQLVLIGLFFGVLASYLHAPSLFYKSSTTSLLTAFLYLLGSFLGVSIYQGMMNRKALLDLLQAS